jgi:nucleoside-diphosphate kinase
MEQTMVILKPDCVSRGLIGEIMHRFERKGLKVVALKMEELKAEVMDEHYAHIKDKPFYKEVLDFMISVPAVLMVLEGKESVNVVRQMTGETSGRAASPGTIRGDFSMSVMSNVIHVSDSTENAKNEVKRFFSESELHSYNKIDVDMVYNADEKK